MVRADEDGATGATVPLYDVRVEKVRKGAVQTETVKVRTLGTDPGADYPVLQQGHTHVLYLSPFMWHPGTSTGEFVITGQQAAYQLHGGDARRTGSMGELPAAVCAAAAEG